MKQGLRDVYISPPPPIEQIQKPLSEQLATKDAQISALTQMLLEKNPAAGPGAQQAVNTFNIWIQLCRVTADDSPSDPPAGGEIIF